LANAKGQILAQQLRAVKYLECSNILNDGVQEIFKEAVRAALQKDNGSKKKCIVI
jgi:hypothetical protein